MSFLQQVGQVIQDSDVPIGVLIVAAPDEICNGPHQTILEQKLINGSKGLTDKYKLIKLCIDIDSPPWPWPQYDILYYFRPRDHTPLFVRREDQIGLDVEKDLQIINHMMSDNISYAEAFKRIQETTELYKETEKMFEEEEKLPPTSKMLRGFAKEMWNSAKAAGKGLPVLVPAEVATERYTICEGCPKLTEEFRCTECGCFMKKKTQLAQSSCPLGKWDKFNKE